MNSTLGIELKQNEGSHIERVYSNMSYASHGDMNSSSHVGILQTQTY
jgi:hypothetical protein